MPFAPGQSGNPAGRQFGSRNKRTILVEKIFEDRAGGLATKAIDLAQAGDPAALRVCMDRVAPPLRQQPFDFDMPTLTVPTDALVATNAIAQGVAHADLPAHAAAVLMKIVRDFVVLAKLIAQNDTEAQSHAASLGRDEARYIDWARDAGTSAGAMDADAATVVPR